MLLSPRWLTTLQKLRVVIQKICEEKQAETVLFSYIDLPCLNKSVSKKIWDSHIEYKSEYTFADGYPYGFTPEALNAGTIGILAELAKTSQKALGDAPVTRDGIYNLIKTDINSFEVDDPPKIAGRYTDRVTRFSFSAMQIKPSGILYSEIMTSSFCLAHHL